EFVAGMPGTGDGGIGARVQIGYGGSIELETRPVDPCRDTDLDAKCRGSCGIDRYLNPAIFGAIRLLGDAGLTDGGRGGDELIDDDGLVWSFGIDNTRQHRDQAGAAAHTAVGFAEIAFRRIAVGG